MKKKVIKLKEADIEKLVGKIIKKEQLDEALPGREQLRKDTQYRRDSFNPYEREESLMGVFGPYAQDVPPIVIQYMRKNPAAVVKRLMDVYGKDRILKYMGLQ